VLGNVHPTSPTIHEVNGFLSDDTAELNGFARRLLAGRELAEALGRAARQTVLDKFSRGKPSARALWEAIRVAREKWQTAVAVGSFGWYPAIFTDASADYRRNGHGRGGECASRQIVETRV